MNLSIYYSGRTYKLNVKSLGFLSRFRGLMFRGSDTENLLFDFGRDVRFSIHSFFVFFSFLAVWLDSENKVIEYMIVRPFLFGIRPKIKFRRLVEIPITKGSRNVRQMLKDASR